MTQIMSSVAAIAVGSALALSATVAAADPAGLRMIEIDMPHHDKAARATIWYPAGDGGHPKRFAQNAVFQGVDTMMGAEVADGSHPVVLLSHGMGGSFFSTAWLASSMADAGAIVVAVNHPYGTFRDFDLSKGARHWTRAQDLSVALDVLLQEADFAGHIDTTRVMAAGFSFGGWTALALGGMTSDHAGFVAACEDYIESMAACDLFLSDYVNVQGMDPDVWNASYADARVTHVAAIDPGLVWGHSEASVAGLTAETLIIGFGAAGDRMQATDFDASGLADLVPEAQIVRIAPATHFTGMPICSAKAEMILKAEGDDPVCTDPEGTDRAAVHARIVALMADQLGL